jgi:Mn2+/Fe2+ NRAMP family transporter
MKNNRELEMQTHQTTHCKSEKVLALISFGVIVYSLIQLFSDNNQTSNTYVGAILLSSIILILSLGIIGITGSSRLNSQTKKKE